MSVFIVSVFLILMFRPSILLVSLEFSAIIIYHLYCANSNGS